MFVGSFSTLFSDMDQDVFTLDVYMLRLVVLSSVAIMWTPSKQRQYPLETDTWRRYVLNFLLKELQQGKI